MDHLRNFSCTLSMCYLVLGCSGQHSLLLTHETRLLRAVFSLPNCSSFSFGLVAEEWMDIWKKISCGKCSGVAGLYSQPIGLLWGNECRGHAQQCHSHFVPLSYPVPFNLYFSLCKTVFKVISIPVFLPFKHYLRSIHPTSDSRVSAHCSL